MLSASPRRASRKRLLGNPLFTQVAPPTNVFDAAARKWALPFILRVGSFPGRSARSRLQALAACMRAPDPANRPSFATALAFLEGVD